MKTPEETVEYIDHWIANSLDRPEMYASSPIALEEMVSLLESLRSFILEQEPSEPWRLPSPYSAYLVAQGYGSGCFTSKNESHGFEGLVAFLRQYLITQNRTQRGEHGKMTTTTD